MGERGLGGLFGRPRGEPERPLLEASLFFLAFYLTSYAAVAAAPPDPRSPGFYLIALAGGLPRALLILYAMATGEGLTAFGLERPRGRDLLTGLLTAVGAFALVSAASLSFSAFGLRNPLFSTAGAGPRPGLALAPLFLASAAVTGYGEELFFRAYLMRRLGQGGMGPAWAALASSLLFGSGHAYQGLVGVVSGSLLGLFFAWRWLDSRNIHAISIGHGLYDAAALAILAYS